MRTRIAPLGTCDLGADVAAALPLTVICTMLGISSTAYDLVLEQSNIICGAEALE